MSKEERIQQQVAEKLGFRVEPIVEDEGTFAQVVSMADGECYANLNDTQMFALWSALIAAETKLEPQTVAEPIDGKFGWLNGQIVNLVSGEAIPKDEPLFLLRGRDHVAYNAITAYLSECEESGCNELHLAGIGQVRDRFAQFAIDHPERMKQPGITRHLKLSPVPDTKGLETK